MHAIRRKLMSLWQRRTVSEHILYTIVFVIFALFALSYLYCLGWCFVAGLKTHGEVVLDPFA